MYRSTTFSKVLLISGSLFAATLLLAAASPAAPTANWNQERVTKIAHELHEAVDELYRVEYKSPEVSSGSRGGGTHYQFMDTLRRMRNETRHLASSLKKGATAESTTGSVKQVKVIFEDLVMFARRIELDNPVLNQFAVMEDLIHRITPYYHLQGKPEKEG
jgi:hypothetical protein